MIKALFSTLFITLLSFGLALLVLPLLDHLPAGLELVTHYAPYPFLIFTMLLSLSFNQTRLFFVLYLSMILLLLILGDLKLADYIPSFDKYKFIHLVFLLYLAAVVFFLFLKERGLFTLQGLLRLCLSTALPLIPLLLAAENSPVNTEWLSMAVFPVEISQKLLLPDVIVAVYILAMTILLFALFSRPGVVERSYFALLSGAGLSLYFFPATARVEFLFTVALLLVLVFIIRNSFYLAYRDELTGLPGRRALREQMNKLGSLYSIAMIDVDFFKKFNDRYGHDAGDQVLKMVARHIDRTGSGGKAYRYGGEEFTLVFPGREVADIREELELLREAIADAGFIPRDRKRPANKPAASSRTAARKSSGKAVKVTVSIGVADNQGTGSSPDEVIKVADKALYRAKKKGRNRVST